jgi:flagellar hook-associated protein 2
MPINLGSMSGGTSAGSITGQLDVQWIVEQIIYAKQQPIRDLEVYQNFYNAKKTAFQELNTHLSAVESSLYNINSSGFTSKTAASSNEDYLTASSAGTAPNGSFAIIVRQLAAAQSDMSDPAALGGISISDPSEMTLNDGQTFSITQDGETVDIEIAGQTRSLNGLKNAINSSGLDVTAVVINDGTDYHLQVTSNSTGADNGFTIDDTDVGTNMTTKITAKDALININTATEADAISRSSNSISDIIQGVTLNLKKADVNEPLTLTVSADSSALKEKMQTFVDAFNSAKDFINEQNAFNTELGRAGVLSGESALRQIQMNMLNIVSSRVDGIEDTEGMKTLANIGITLDDLGKLQIDDTKLDNAIANNIDSVTRLFKTMGTAENSDISYISKTSDTKAGTYAVNITQVAEQAKVTSDSTVSDTLGTDETLTITYKGKDYTVELTADMTLSQVVSAVNDTFSSNNVPVFASADGNSLVIASNDYGSNQSVKVSSTGSALFDAEKSDQGQDVAGTINGQAAAGTGQKLVSSSGDSKGLTIYVSATTIGEKDDVYLTFGVGEQLRERVNEFTFPYSGLIAKNLLGLDDQLENISEKITQINRGLEQEQYMLIQQFSKANEALAQLTYLQSTLSNSAAK